ncbi:hypothetical protein ACI2OX_21905 [Bacillus sp. N9]
MKDGIHASDLLKRTEMKYAHIHELIPAEQQLPTDVIEQVEIQIKYEGYIVKSLQQVERLKNWRIKNP